MGGAAATMSAVASVVATWSPLQQALAALAAGYGLLLLWHMFHVRDHIKYRHIPGPMPIPAIGNLHTVGPKHKELLWNAFAEWRGRYGKVFKWFLGQHCVVVITDPEMLRQITVKHFRTFHDRALLYAPQPKAFITTHSAGLTFIKGPLWASIKSAMQPMVHTDGLTSAAAIINNTFEEAVPVLQEAASKGTPLDLRRLTAAMTLKVIGHAAFGLDLDTLTKDPKVNADNARLVKASDDALAAIHNTLWTTLIPYALRPLAWPLLTAFPTPRLAKMRAGRSQLFVAAIQLTKNAMARLGIEWKDDIGMEKAFDNPSSRVVKEMYKDKQPAEGSAIDLLVKARNKETGEELKAHHIVAQANATLVGGHDTTAFTLTAALLFLATHPEAEAKVLAEVDAFGRAKPVSYADLPSFPYLDAVLKETLRLLPPVWMTSREAGEDITIEGWHLPKGTVVYLDLYGMHRDPQQFPDPLAFRPERFYDKEGPEAAARHPYAWAAFGAGPRTCLGYRLGSQEVVQVLARLYQHFTFELDPAMTRLGPDGLPPMKAGLHLQFHEGVYFRVHERPKLRR